jgi:polar amino acid transport system substrate-binding protein
MRVVPPFLLALLLGASVSPAVAVERLAVGTNFSRIFEQGSDGQWRGLGVDVLRTLAARAGDTVRFQSYPWPRAQAMVERGQADILIGPYRSPARLKQFAFLDQPFYRDRLVFYARSRHDVPWAGDVGTLAGRRIVSVRGWHYGTRFDQARPLLDISEVAQVENGLQMLVHGRVDLLATNERNTTALIDSLRLREAVTVLCPEIGRLDGYLAFPREAAFAAARTQYNTLFNQMVRSGELFKLGVRNGVLVPTADVGTDLGPAGCK